MSPFDFRLTHERQTPDARHAEHERIQKAAQERIRQGITHHARHEGRP